MPGMKMRPIIASSKQERDKETRRIQRASRESGKESSSQAAQAPKVVVALYDFEGEQKGDLSFALGQRIVLLDTSQSWWKGHLAAEPETVGHFPSNYVAIEGSKLHKKVLGKGDRDLIQRQKLLDEKAAAAQNCCRLTKSVLKAALAAATTFILAWVWVVAGSNIAEIPLWAFHGRYRNIYAASLQSATLNSIHRENTLNMSQLFIYMSNSTPFLQRGAYLPDGKNTKWLFDDQSIEERLGKKALTVETRPHGELWFGFGAVEYRSISAKAFLGRRRGKVITDSQSKNVDWTQFEVSLVQHPIKVPPPTFVNQSVLKIESTNLWMSGNPDGGEISGCHYDLSDNLHVVLAGTKTFTLFPPGDTAYIYPMQPADGLGAFESAYSSVRDVSLEAERMGLHSRYPRLKSARRITVTLQAGDMLFIPRLWWHQVSVNKGAPATSINFWFRNAYSFPDKLSREFLRLNYDLYIEKRQQTLGYSRADIFGDELFRIIMGPRPLPRMEVAYAHNPSQLTQPGQQRSDSRNSVLSTIAPDWKVPEVEHKCERLPFSFSVEELGSSILEDDDSSTVDSVDTTLTTDFDKLVQRRAVFEDNINRANALAEMARSTRNTQHFESAHSFAQRALAALPDSFEGRWFDATLLMELKRPRDSLKQLRCAVPFVPQSLDIRAAFFRTFMVTLQEIPDALHLLPGLLAASRAFIPLAWQNPLQLTTSSYLPEAEDRDGPRPFYDEWCDSTASQNMCQILEESATRFTDEVFAMLSESNRTNRSIFQEEGGVGGIKPVGSAPPSSDGDISSAVFGSGGEIWLFDQMHGRKNEQACKLLPSICSTLQTLTPLFARMRREAYVDDDISGDPEPWAGVVGGISLQKVEPWTRVYTACRARSNALLTILLPIALQQRKSMGKPYIKVGKERRFFEPETVLVLDSAFSISGFHNSKIPFYLLRMQFFKPALCKRSNHCCDRTCHTTKILTLVWHAGSAAGYRCATSAVELVPPPLRSKYTMNGTVPVIDWLLGPEMDNRPDTNLIKHASPVSPTWSAALVDAYIKEYERSKIHQRAYSAHVKLSLERNAHVSAEPAGIWNTFLVQNPPMHTATGLHVSEDVESEPYPGAALLHCCAFDTFPIDGQRTAVLGSITPWIEAIVFHYGGVDITTVEYNVPKCQHPLLNTIDYDTFATHADESANLGTFDVVVTYSSVEHAGLGRYGDELDPDADLATMHAIWRRLSPGGLLFWGAPVGQDGLMWNAMRIYGHKRLKVLWEGFEVLQWFGHNESVLDEAPLWEWTNQPVVVLRKV